MHQFEEGESVLKNGYIAFPSNHPKWSYAKTDSNNLVTEVKEKVVISDKATVGIYFFTKGKDFINGTLEMISNADKVNQEYYVCPVYNYLIKDQKKIGVFNIDEEMMHGIGTPEDLEIYKKLI